jgi:hypothetical protein
MFIVSINVSAKLMMKRAIKPIHPFCQHSALMSSKMGVGFPCEQSLVGYIWLVGFG